jgi:inosose dehydratase
MFFLNPMIYNQKNWQASSGKRDPNSTLPHGTLKEFAMTKKPSSLPVGVRLGVSPLSWVNDVLEDLGANIPLETCLAEAAQAGYEGIELGRKFPREAELLGPILKVHGLDLVSGWYNGFLTERDVATEIAEVKSHAALLKVLGCSVMVYGECGGMYPDAPLDAPLSKRLRLHPYDFAAYAARLGEFGRHIQGEYGLTLAYHHHLMMVAENFDEVSTLIDVAPASVGLLLDTGHAYGGGFDYTKLIDRFGDRIVHIHLKDVRADIFAGIRNADRSFNEGVRAGMFTVPGDGVLDFAPLARFVKTSGYRGWLVVEAEQDPKKAPPLAMVSKAYEAITAVFASK